MMATPRKLTNIINLEDQNGRPEYEIEMTYACNWDCPYCSVETHTKKAIPINEIMNKVRAIPAGANVTISGGETSYVDILVLLEVIQILKLKNCIVFLNTNGRAFVYNTYTEAIKRVDGITFHCSENLRVEEIPNYDGMHSNLRYMVVVTDDNYFNLSEFLDINSKAYPQRKFDIVAASNPHGVNRPYLSKHNKEAVLKYFKKHMTQESKLRLLEEKDFSRVQYITNYITKDK